MSKTVRPAVEVALLVLMDMKEGLRPGGKPDTSHIRTPARVYGARAHEYGAEKYERANYLRPVGDVKGDFERFRAYLRATIDHCYKTLDAMELHQATDPKLEDVEGMKKAAACPDMEAGKSFPASGLPHVSHALASLNMAITQGAVFGLLPSDPGQPWKESGR